MDNNKKEKNMYFKGFRVDQSIASKLIGSNRALPKALLPAQTIFLF
jgi:hypothetical protein